MYIVEWSIGANMLGRIATQINF